MNSTFKKLSTVFAIGSLIVSILSGCYFFPTEDVILKPPLKIPEKPKYDTVKAERGDVIRSVTGQAQFQYARRIDLSFDRQAGTLKQFHVNPGDMVKKGQLLLELNTDDAEGKLKAADAALKKAKLSVEQTKKEGEVAVKLALSRLNELKEEYAALKANPELTTPKELEDLEKRVYEEELNYQLTLQRSGPDGFNVQLAQMALEDAQRTYDEAKAAYEGSRMVAPIDGEIVYVKNDINEGAPVPAYTRIITIADTTKLQLEYKNGEHISKMNLSTVMDIKINGKGEPNKIYQGKVVQIPPLPKFQGDNPPQVVVIDVADPPEDIQSGDFASFTLVLEKAENVIKIPSSAIQTFGGRTYVFVLDENGIRKEVDVEVGLRTSTEAEIRKGLEEGDEVFLR